MSGFGIFENIARALEALDHENYGEAIAQAFHAGEKTLSGDLPRDLVMARLSALADGEDHLRIQPFPSW